MQALVTGFPSRKATAVVERLLLEGHQVSVLAREPAAVTRLLGARDGMRVYAGEPWAIDFGLSAKEYAELSANTTHVFHVPNARLGSGQAEATRDCVSATREALNFFRQLGPDARLLHVSTVLALRELEGVATEDMEADPSNHRSQVLRAYARAERMVDQDKSERSFIVRTGIAFGDAVTGDFEPGSWGHVLAAFVLSSPEDLPLPIPVPDDSTLNLVSTDFLARAVVAIGTSPLFGGRRHFHVVDSKPYDARRVLELVATAAGRPQLRYSMPAPIWKALWRAPLVGMAAGRGRAHVVEGLLGSSVYDNANARAVIGELADACPDFKDYVAPVVQRMKEHRRAGRNLLDAGLSDDDIPG